MATIDSTIRIGDQQDIQRHILRLSQDAPVDETYVLTAYKSESLEIKSSEVYFDL